MTLYEATITTIREVGHDEKMTIRIESPSIGDVVRDLMAMCHGFDDWSEAPYNSDEEMNVSSKRWVEVARDQWELRETCFIHVWEAERC